MTTAECLAKGLPMVIAQPLPGQERCNTEFLVEHGVAVHVESVSEIVREVEALLGDPDRLHTMRVAALQQAYPDSADQVAQLINQSAPEQELNLS